MSQYALCEAVEKNVTRKISLAHFRLSFSPSVLLLVIHDLIDLPLRIIEQ